MGMNSSNSSGLLETRHIFQHNKQEMVLIMGNDIEPQMMETKQSDVTGIQGSFWCGEIQRMKMGATPSAFGKIYSQPMVFFPINCWGVHGGPWGSCSFSLQLAHRHSKASYEGIVTLQPNSRGAILADDGLKFEASFRGYDKVYEPPLKWEFHIFCKIWWFYGIPMRL